MLSKIEKFAVLFRWIDSKGKGSIGAIAKNLRLPKEEVQAHIMEIEAKANGASRYKWQTNNLNVYVAAHGLATKANQVVGEKNEYYITLPQLERILAEEGEVTRRVIAQTPPRA